MTPPKQVLQLIERSVRERSVRNLSEYKRPDYKEARVRAGRLHKSSNQAQSTPP